MCLSVETDTIFWTSIPLGMHPYRMQGKNKRRLFLPRDAFLTECFFGRFQKYGLLHVIYFHS
jgi:hypothetical protein